ncbi:hypothetical protein NL108_001255 [Boleophthalmus pectinirostris]|nr:hypothetical protein NL108_001255 [Boleophthalmus pectinirostris]
MRLVAQVKSALATSNSSAKDNMRPSASLTRVVLEVILDLISIMLCSRALIELFMSPSRTLVMSSLGPKSARSALNSASTDAKSVPLAVLFLLRQRASFGL